MKIKISEIVQDSLEAMTTGQKLLVAGAAFAVLAAVLFGGFSLSSYQVRKLEKEVTAAKDNAERWEEFANKSELKAAEYKAKIEMLEGDVAELQTIAKVQDEKIHKASAGTAAARDNVRRAAGVRAIDSSADELCAKLAEVGHPCP